MLHETFCVVAGIVYYKLLCVAVFDLDVYRCCQRTVCSHHSDICLSLFVYIEDIKFNVFRITTFLLETWFMSCILKQRVLKKCTVNFMELEIPIGQLVSWSRPRVKA